MDASPNDTDQERSGTITVYAAVSSEALNDVINGGKADPAQVVSTTVLVKQEPAGAVSGDIESIDFLLDVNTFSNTHEDDFFKNKGTLSAKDGTIKTSMKGDGMHVECAQVVNYSNSTVKKVYNITVSFDIDDAGAIESKKAKIINLKYHADVDVSYYTTYYEDESGNYHEVDPWVHGKGTEEEAIEVTNIPMSGGSTWSGTAGEGVKFSNLVNKNNVDWYNFDGSFSNTTNYNATLVDSPSNNCSIAIHFK